MPPTHSGPTPGDVGDRRAEALYLSNLGRPALEKGDLEEARELQRTSLHLRLLDGAGLALAASLEIDGALSITEGRSRRGVCLCSAAQALRERLAAPVGWSVPETVEPRLAGALQALGEPEYAAAQAGEGPSPWPTPCDPRFLQAGDNPRVNH